MADREDDYWANHKGGFKRPPPWGQFQKGQSGNPNGRPRKKDKQEAAKRAPKLTEFEEQVRDLLGEEALITLNGKKVPVTKKRAILLNLFKQAMGGQPLAMREMNRIIDKVEAKEEEQARADAEAAEQTAKEKAKQDEAWYRRLVDLKEKQAGAWTRAAAEGREEPKEPWPHSDDILINHAARTARVRGPLDLDGLADWEFLRRSRDHHLARVVYHTFLEERVHRLKSKMWLVALVECDLVLPKRWQISHDITHASDQLIAMGFPKLEALIEVGATVFEAGSSNKRLSREAYSTANRKWGPLIKMLGFKSLRHLERAGEEVAD